MINSTEKLSGRERSKLRRQQMSKNGSADMKQSGRASQGRKKPDVVSTTVSSHSVQSNSVLKSNSTESELLSSSTQAANHDNHEYCCDDCKEKDLKETCSTCDTSNSASENSEAVDALCDLVNSAQSDAPNTVRAYCRDRRKQLSKIGKQALPGKVGREARRTRVNNNKSPLSGRDLAKLKREERCSVGRGSNDSCKPSGRIRPGKAPSKVEVGTTLSGQSVSGTSVEQTLKITGSESGTCKAVTGSEYFGTEQYQELCSSIPSPSKPKVNESTTSNGQTMTGSLVESTSNVTGTEPGSCTAITGSEYLGSDHFANSCSNQGGVISPMKVVESISKNNLVITGVDETRINSATGSESKSDKVVTGSDYSVAPYSRSNGNAKVDVNHTNRGSVISGGENSSPLGVTGDAQDSCKHVTGTEYVSNERFVANCGDKAPLTPSKVLVDTTRKGMDVTGNMMDRNDKVSGNEPGTCQKVSGSQYDSSANRAMCDQRSNKVSHTHTITGNHISGSEVSGSPKLTGDDYGMCLGVTGNEYVSKESFEQRCDYVPMAAAYKDRVSDTWNNQQLSGSQLGQSELVSGDEVGTCNTISGSSYRSRKEMSQYCDRGSIEASEKIMRTSHTAKQISGNVPSSDPRFSGNFNKGFDQSLSGSAYVDNQYETEKHDSDFSVQTPARSANQNRSERLHDSVFGINARITGPISKAQGVMTGTPEFRHPVEQQQSIQPQIEVPTKVVTGEGSETGKGITGDDWSRGENVTGTEGMFAANRNTTQKGGSVNERLIGAHALKDREVVIFEGPDVTSGNGGGSGTNGGSSRITLSGGARG